MLNASPLSSPATAAWMWTLSIPSYANRTRLRRFRMVSKMENCPDCCVRDYLFRTANVIFSLLLGCQFVWYFLFLSVSSISISTNTQEWISMNFSRYSEMAYTWIQDVWFFFSILLDWEGGVFIIYIPGKPVTFSWHFQHKLDKEQLVKNWE